ncbi:MAG: hypothetical protein AMXMBFR76_21520 [Pseudomonadota bacterium]
MKRRQSQTAALLRERRAFEAQAKRDCLALNEAARDPNSDEASVMRELVAMLDDPSYWEDWTPCQKIPNSPCRNVCASYRTDRRASSVRRPDLHP